MACTNARQAVPLVKLGAYLTVLECAAAALCVGVLALAPPRIVGMMGSVPSWSKALVAAIGFVALAWQAAGIASVIPDNTALYRLYIRVNFILTVALIVVTIAFTAVGAARHNRSVVTCIELFEQPIGGNGLGIARVQNTLHNARQTACKVITWLDVGVSFGLIVLIGLVQLYMCYMQRRYGQRQRSAAFDAKPNTYPISEDIPLAPRDSGVWEPSQSNRYQPLNESRPPPRA